MVRELDRLGVVFVISLMVLLPGARSECLEEWCKTSPLPTGGVFSPTATVPSSTQRSRPTRAAQSTLGSSSTTHNTSTTEVPVSSTVTVRVADGGGAPWIVPAILLMLLSILYLVLHRVSVSRVFLRQGCCARAFTWTFSRSSRRRCGVMPSVDSLDGDNLSTVSEDVLIDLRTIPNEMYGSIYMQCVASSTV
jgi:hypothetical protein